MYRVSTRLLLLLLTLTVFSAVASATQIGAGVLSLDAQDPLGQTGSFDISNFTGPFPQSIPPDFPILTHLTFTITSLTVNFTIGPPAILTAANFASDGFGGFLGSTTYNLVTNPIFSAVLVGTFSPTSGVNDGSATVTIDAAFTDVAGAPSVTLTGATGGPLITGESAVIYAKAASVGVVPEPGTGALLGGGLAGLAFGLLMRRRTLPLGRSQTFAA
jgi:hypothetical protein